MRSVNKGPFVEPSLIRKVKKHIASKSKLAIKTKSRNSDIIADFVGLSFDVYNGKRYHLVNITPNMVGCKLGEFSPTRTFIKHSGVKTSTNIKKLKNKK